MNSKNCTPAILVAFTVMLPPFSATAQKGKTPAPVVALTDAGQALETKFAAAQFENGQKKKNALLTVRHNGVLIHENVEVPNPTRAAPVPENAEPGPLYLQNHNHPVRFRNIWFVPTKSE